MLNDQQAVAICELYSLGMPIASLTRVPGGLIHSMYCLHTDKGRYAVKILDRHIMTIPNIREAFRRSEAVAAEFAAARIPAVYALSSVQGTVADVGADTVMVYPWIEGATLAIGPAGNAVGRQIGAIIGRMHGLELNSSRFDVPTRSVTDPAEWQRLSDDGLAKEIPWAEEISAKLPDIVAWENLGVRASMDLGDRHVSATATST
jgi:Ser/Thr protein kinase RdoA (MazF antagonist)